MVTETASPRSILQYCDTKADLATRSSKHLKMDRVLSIAVNLELC